MQTILRSLFDFSYFPVESDPQRSRQLQSKLPKRPKHTRHPQRPRASGQEDRHPFALYGSGERDADISGRKTHNVGPAASTKQVCYFFTGSLRGLYGVF